MLIVKKQITFNRVLLVVTLSFTLTSCSPDDGPDDIAITERTKIIMDIPSSNGGIDWKNSNLVWSQDFNDPTSFEEDWIFEKNLADVTVADQLQKYKSRNVEVSGGKLKIHAKKEGPGQNKGDYTSGRISSKYAFQHGRIEIRAKLPEGAKSGLWSQIALVGEYGHYPGNGLINIMEYFSYKPNAIFVTVHSTANNTNNSNLITGNLALETAEEEFHTYGILWTDNYIKFYIDDPEHIFFVLNRPSDANDFNWPFDKPFYFVTGMVVGGQHAGFAGVDDSIFPAVMEIDHVRVYHAE
jgi:beta-glucanase (GH16 family)